MWIMIILMILLGWLAGWLVNYLADVLPVTRRFSQPTCPKCQTPFSWGDYLSLHSCRSCGQPRSRRTLIVQAVLTITPVLLYVFPRQTLPLPLGFPLIVYLALVMIIDLEHRLVLHPVSLIGALLGLGIGLYLHRLMHAPQDRFLPTLEGGAAGFGIMLVFYCLGELYVRWMAKRRGLATDEVALGFGDVNLAGIMGLLLGWPLIIEGLLFAILIGGVISLVIILVMLALKRYQAFTAIPYAPFLILSALLLYIH